VCECLRVLQCLEVLPALTLTLRLCSKCECV